MSPFLLAGNGASGGCASFFAPIASLVSAQKGDSNFDLPFIVSGPWEDPLIFPEAESLIRRSTTVAPLLDALKGGKTVVWGAPGNGAAKNREIQILFRDRYDYLDVSAPGTAVAR